MKTRNIIFGALLSVLVSFAVCQQLQAATDTPDPGAVGGLFNTGDGDHALFNAAPTLGNSAFGWFSQFANATGNFNTSVGAASLDLNGFSNNTAVGAAAALFSQGDNNTAVGAAALENNNANANTAMGAFALFANTSGTENVAVGFSAMLANDANSFSTAVGFEAMSAATGGQNTAFGNHALNVATGNQNTAIGDVAGGTNGSVGITSGFGNTVVGAFCGRSIATGNSNTYVGTNVDPGAAEDNHIRIGDNLPEFPAESSQCFIGGVNSHVAVANGFTICQVTVDAFSHLGVDCTNLSNGQNQGLPQVPGHAQSNPANPQNRKPQAMLNRKVEELETTVAQLKAQLKEQAAQIQKVSAQLEVNKPAAKVVVNKP
jgi:hypothetical protein